MQDLIRPDASFTPRELFARMQGAWFEPRIGSMWKENTGVTLTTTGGQTVGKLVDLTAARVASQATAANRPIFGVRRNLLTYSEDISNVVWNKYGNYSADFSVAPNGTLTAYLLYFGVYNSIVLTEQTTLTASIYLKSYGWRYVSFRLDEGVLPYCCIDTETWEITDGGGVIIENAENGFKRLITTKTINSGNCYITVDFMTGPLISNYLATPDNVNGFIVWGSQINRGSVADIYQRITTATDYDPGPYPALAHDGTDSLSVALPDLGGGIFSSYGSVYFSTPSGMSALHNQSIGTTYNLPAPNTDIYGTVITPARLVPPLEQRLALYMYRLAGLSDADFFWQEQATDGMTGQLLTDDGTILLRG